MSTSTEYMDGLNTPAERRFYPRVTPPTPIYVAFGSNNLGVLHNVSENGLQVSTPIGLQLNSVFRVFLSLNGAPKTIAVTVRTIWSDSMEKRSGIQLLDLGDEDRAQIRKWIELELSRGGAAPPWHAPKNGDRRVPKPNPLGELPEDGRQNFGARAVPPPRTAPPVSSSEPAYTAPLSNAEQRRSGRRFNGAFVPRDQITSEPLPDEVAAFASSANDATELKREAFPPPQNAARTPSASVPLSDQPPAGTQPAAVPPEVNEAELPRIANPFDHPDPNAQFDSPFAKVPLPIHGDFEYASQPPKQRRRPSVSSHMRAKPLIIWVVILAVVCFGANALVRYKIKLNAQHYASESARYTAPKSDAAGPDSTTPVDDSGANASNSSPADSQSAVNPNINSASKDQANSQTLSAEATAARDQSSETSTAAASKTAPRRESALDASDIGGHSATAPTASDRSEYTERTSQPPAAPRSWNAPAPNHSGSSGVSASDTPQSPIMTSSSDNAPAQAASIVAQSRPTAPPAPAVQPQSTNSTSTAAPSNTNSAANNAPARTQPSANPQPQVYAANSTPANTTQSRPQSQIYNANASQQRSAVMGSINSVHSSGIFDSNDTTTANAAPAAASRSNNRNANVAARSVANNSVAPIDSPQERDVEIAAPKGFTASYVDLPGEHLVRTPTATVRMRRFVRVPGERIPGQRWLWRGKLNVTLGDVVNRIDPSIVQASGATGSLTVQATIDKDGYVTDLKPINGNFAMLPSVSRAVRNWHYEPTYLDSKRADTLAEIEFDLRPTAANNRTQR